jgi:hypothetical protein
LKRPVTWNQADRHDSIVSNRNAAIRHVGTRCPQRTSASTVWRMNSICCSIVWYRSKGANFRGIVNQTLMKESQFASAGRGLYRALSIYGIQLKILHFLPKNALVCWRLQYASKLILCQKIWGFQAFRSRKKSICKSVIRRFESDLGLFSFVRPFGHTQVGEFGLLKLKRHLRRRIKP